MKKTNTALFMILFLLAAGTNGLAQEDETETETETKGDAYFINFSLYYPVSLNQSKHDRVNLNLTLINSRVGYVSGFDFSVIASSITHRLNGVQICGLSSVVGESGQGMQVSGLINVSGGNFKGFQGAGLMNIVGEDLSGFQIGGLMNVAGQNGRWFQAAGLGSVAGENFSGIQISGIFSVAGQKGTGFQLSGFFNVAGESFDGLQAAGLFNVTGSILRGFQCALFNVAAESKGVQIGVVNAGGSSSGVQIGIVNYTKEENTGVPFGLVNLAENGSISKIFWGGNSVAATGGVKFIVGRVYSILSLGGFNLDDGVNGSLTYGFHYGINFPAGSYVISTDLGYRYRDNKSLFRHSSRNPDQHVLEARLILGIPVTDNLSLLLGAGARRFYDIGKKVEYTGTSPLFIAGIEIH